MAELVVAGLTKAYAEGNRNAVDAVDFTVADGEFFTLLGPSGCGKSTTLTCIAGLNNPDGGRISLGDRILFDHATRTEVPCEQRNFGMVFQSYALWPHMTVADNLAMPLKIRKLSVGERRTKIADALDKVELGAYAARYPHELSGGQQQRVALARALVYEPELLLLDEPLSNLDAKLRDSARVWLKRVQRDLGITTIYVTHDQEEALAMSDRIAVMDSGQMMQVGAPREIYEEPSNVGVAAFIGSTNFLEGKVAGTDGDGLVAVQIAGTNDKVRAKGEGASSAGDAVTLGFRPEDLHLADSVSGDARTNHITGQLFEVSYVGSRYEYRVRYADTVLLMYGLQDRDLGDVVLAIQPDRVRCFRGVNAIDDDVKAELEVLVQA